MPAGRQTCEPPMPSCGRQGPGTQPAAALPPRPRQNPGFCPALRLLPGRWSLREAVSCLGLPPGQPRQMGEEGFCGQLRGLPPTPRLRAALPEAGSAGRGGGLSSSTGPAPGGPSGPGQAGLAFSYSQARAQVVLGRGPRLSCQEPTSGHSATNTDMMTEHVPDVPRSQQQPAPC